MDVSTNGAPSAGDSYMPPITSDQAISVREAARLHGAEMTAKEQPAPKSDASEAARTLSQAGWEKRRQAQAVEQPAPVEAAQELPEQGNDSPAEPVPVETEAADPAELPPIEPPRSWTKEHKEAFAALPRDIQERVSDVERAREVEFNRRQNEAAEKLKGLSAKEQQAEQVRQQYEAALPILLNQLQQQGGEFADITTPADLQRVAAEDPARYLRWDAHQKQVNAVAQEYHAAQQRQAQEQSEAWAKFAQEQDQRVTEKIPDLADPAKASKMREQAASLLHDHGFEADELNALYNGKRGVSLRDARVQAIIHDAMKWREAQEARAKVTAVPKPPVLRPGVSQGKGAHTEALIQSAKDRLSTAKGAAAVRAAADLQKLERSLKR